MELLQNKGRLIAGTLGVGIITGTIGYQAGLWRQHTKDQNALRDVFSTMVHDVFSNVITWVGENRHMKDDEAFFKGLGDQLVFAGIVINEEKP